MQGNLPYRIRKCRQHSEYKIPKKAGGWRTRKLREAFVLIVWVLAFALGSWAAMVVAGGGG
jgi:hypothetical protein